MLLTPLIGLVSIVDNTEPQSQQLNDDGSLINSTDRSLAGKHMTSTVRSLAI